MSERRRISKKSPGAASRAGALPLSEQLHARAEELHLCDTEEVVRRLHDADREAVRAVGEVLSEISVAADWMTETLRTSGRVFYVGAGTSGRLGALDAAELPPTFGLPRKRVVSVIAGGLRALSAAVEGAEDDAEGGASQLRRRRVRDDDLVIGITASGSTPFVVGALAHARSVGAGTILICTCERPRARADLVIAPQTGPELIAGSTRLKAGTATKLVLNAISTAAMVRLGKVFRGRMIDVQPTNAKLRERAVRIVTELSELSPAEARRKLSKARWNVREVLDASGALGRLSADEVERPRVRRRSQS